jgi:unsaturated rhamnogalacturonyl hydrolase
MIPALMKRVFEWQRNHFMDCWYQPDGTRREIEPNGWIRSAFFAGVMAAWRATQDQDYFQAALDWAESNRWQPGARLRHADDHCCGQTYLELYAARPQPDMIAPLRATIDQVMANPQPGRVDWWWCDALFMAPPALARLSAATGERKYLDFMNSLWWDTVDFLYDPHAHLFYRDADYLPGTGRETFWSRGNGWVMAGTVRVLDSMPDDYPDRGRYVRLLHDMAGAVTACQSPDDGLWRVNLLNPTQYPTPETSGSGFFCYALAAGITRGWLDRDTYLPVVERAWQGLTGAVADSGQLGWMQMVGKSPGRVRREDTIDFGSGAFLLAGSEVLKLGI